MSRWNRLSQEKRPLPEVLHRPESGRATDRPLPVDESPAARVDPVRVCIAEPRHLLGIARLLERQFFGDPRDIKGRRSRIRSVRIQMRRRGGYYIVAEYRGQVRGAMYVIRAPRGRIFTSNMAVASDLRARDPMIVLQLFGVMLEEEAGRSIRPLVFFADFENPKAAKVFLHRAKKVLKDTGLDDHVQKTPCRMTWLERLRHGDVEHSFLLEAKT